MLLTTTNTLNEKINNEYLDKVFNEAIIDANLFKDSIASITDIVGDRSGSYQRILHEAKENALRKLEDNAWELETNAVIGVDLDYVNMGTNSSMLMVYQPVAQLSNISK
jgi:uncharacterized protein YbjQ (UPF0145 family)